MTLLLGCLVVLMFGALAFVGWFYIRPRLRPGRAMLLVNPAYEDLFRTLELNTAADFLTLGSVIVSGHLDRNVWSVRLEDGSESVTCFLKREHFVTCTTRLRNALAGFGFVSRSWRELRTLQALGRTRIRCPEWLAAGEDVEGQAFLLLREVPDAVELREAIVRQKDHEARRRLARRLARGIARLHSVGFSHPDLYVRHLLIEADGEPCFLDWQRSRPGLFVDWRRRARDLASLQATLADHLASPRERMVFLVEYFRAFEGETSSGNSCSLAAFLTHLLKQTRLLLRRRHVAEKRHAAPQEVDQAWIPLQRDALCITPRLQRLYGTKPPNWLARYREPLPPGSAPARNWVTLPDGHNALLIRRRVWTPLRVRLAQWRRQPPISEDQRTAGLLLRLERYNIPAPRVLAMGQHGLGKGWLESFILMEPAPHSVEFGTWLNRLDRADENAVALRAKLLAQAGALLHQLHEARCYLTDDADGHTFAVQRDETAEYHLVVERSEAVRFSRKLQPEHARRDREALAHTLRRASVGPDDLQHFTRGYQTGGDEESLQGGGPMSLPRPLPQPIAPPRGSLWQRLVHGSHRIMEQEDWPRLVGADWPERIMDVEVTDRFHAKQGRSTGRWRLRGPNGGLTVYLKRHYRLSWWHGLLATFWPRGAWSPAMQEWQHLEWARRQGLPVPRAVAAAEFIGPWGKLQSILAVEELTGMIPLHEAIPLAARQLPPELFQTWKKNLIEELARLTRILHDRRCFHKDLYLCHFYVPQADTHGLPVSWRERIHVIDLHRLAHHPWTWRLWQIKDLAQLLYSSEIEGIDARDRLAFWRAYLGPGQRSATDRWLGSAVRYKWQRYRKHNARRDGSREGTTVGKSAA